MQEFRDAVRKRLQETEMSMSALAREANVGRAYLYRILDGEQTPTIEVADRIAHALGLSIQTVPLQESENS